MISTVILLCWALLVFTIPSRWSLDYSGFEQKDVERLLGAQDSGDFDGGIWFSDCNILGVRVRLWAFKVYYDSSLKVSGQKRIFAPAIMKKMTEDDSVLLRQYNQIHKKYFAAP